jgi:ABC-type multidrug transport system fused ATPase/permease subunit
VSDALVETEKRGTGGFSSEFYLNYARAMPGIHWALPLLLCAVILDTFLGNGFRFLVSINLDPCLPAECSPNGSAMSRLHYYINSLPGEKFVALLVAFTLAGTLFRFLSWFGTLAFLSNGGRQLHNQMVKSLGNAHVQFFDMNPSGRILKRFSSDYLHLRNDIPNYINDIIVSFVELLWVVVLVFFQAPLAAAAALPCAFIYYRVQDLFRPASRELQRLVGVRESPVWTLFSESVAGFQVLRAYGKSESYQSQLRHLTSVALRISLLQSRITRWLNLRLKVSSEIFGLVVGLYICYACATSSLSVAKAGFLMSLTIGLDVTMQWLTRTFSLLESLMVSLERVQEYISLPCESTSRIFKSSLAASQEPKVIAFSNYSARYRKGLPPVLKDLDLSVHPFQRIGVIGPTGAGKSSLFQAFYQMLQIDSGQLTYGGVDLAVEPVLNARALFSIVPQEPILFSGSLRQNLDRLSLCAEAELFAALKMAGLENLISKLPSGLETQLLEKGSNFSLGERQLICLARAALTKSPIILMDEPTASVDPTTDKLVEKASQILFQNRTQIIIAHRLSTVMSCDLLWLVVEGKIEATGSPQVVIDHFMKSKRNSALKSEEDAWQGLLV